LDTLSPELKHAIEEAGDSPVRLMDPETHRTYVLVSAEVFERLVAEEERREHDVFARVARAIDTAERCEVTRAEPLDLSPMVFDAIEWRGRQLEINPPLVLEPTLDEESGQLYTVIDKDLGIDVFATSREQLSEDLAEQLLFAWDAYAREVPEKLTSGARALRDALLSRITERHLATQPERRGGGLGGEGLCAGRGRPSLFGIVSKLPIGRSTVSRGVSRPAVHTSPGIVPRLLIGRLTVS
jgi:hypothetical protein